MRHMRPRFLALLAITWLAAGSAGAQSPPVEVVRIPHGAIASGVLTGHLLRPRAELPNRGTARGPLPAIVALHGCGGLFAASGKISSRHMDWAERWAAAGYVVLLPDSFRSRGIEAICEVKERTVFPRDRARDAAVAADWLAAQPFIDKGRIALIGWSHGGSSTLWSLSQGYAPSSAEFKLAIAFYPGCRVPLARGQWPPRAPVTILIGAADDWTPPAPCRTLAAAHTGFHYVEYPNAVHGFDAPAQPRRSRTGIAYSGRGDGKVEVGTDPAARAAAITEVTRLLAEAFGR